MKTNVKNFLDSIELDIIYNDYPNNKITLRHCIDKDLKNIAAKIIEEKYGLTRDMSLCVINDFQCYWIDRIKNEKNMACCDSCGNNFPIDYMIEVGYNDNGEHYNYTCKSCHDN